ncbi:polysaccharide biosynthesis/export family protein [Sphingomonas oryzagri]|jgi:polysaccharide export outer membrane protein|uniref:Polysaccharide biosynthesis/export family protein n=1 Tax=Sphingomonas oryzagri TaxID=3042314 RepID=A0ABT6MXN1_9SPHN|nr:polysaccharide biosynthesis/export family protein [Sphingomonas oryzagri]MDH7637278.1 polysaccharide biosynthesis/export family protein [Sphingomonas oryzagri]
MQSGFRPFEKTRAGKSVSGRRAGGFSALILLSLCGLAGCATRSTLPSGSAAYNTFPPPNTEHSTDNYKIGPLDTIAVTVFQEPDLTSAAIQVDAAGNVLLPLIGQVSAEDKTSTELAAEISSKLSTRYLTNPQVSVIVTDSVSQHVTVNGSVTEPGVYAIKGRTTLLDALAMAKGTSRVAALDQVAVFRMVNGQRIGGLFDVSKINRGLAPDPEIKGSDTIVVGLSNVKAAWRDVLTAAPLLTAFSYAATR